MQNEDATGRRRPRVDVRTASVGEHRGRESSPATFRERNRPLGASIPQVDPLVDRLSNQSLTERMTPQARICAGKDTEAWFPVEPSVSNRKARAEYELNARVLCAGCSARTECLILALRDESRKGVMPAGIYGGKAPWERKNMLRRHAKQQSEAAVA